MKKEWYSERSNDLYVLLTTIEEKKGWVCKGATRYAKHSKNHRITIENSLTPANIKDCTGCERSLRCLAGKQISLTEAYVTQKYDESKCKCFNEYNLIRFYYRHSCCLSFDIAQRMLIEHGYMGLTTSTNWAIGQYLYALKDNFPQLDLTSERITTLLTFFRKNKTPYSIVI